MSATAVIVVNYNGGRFLPRCLAALAAQQPQPAQVLVVDNASEDGSVDRLPAGVDLLRCPRNLGFGAAVNAGLEATTAPFVLTLNPDTELMPGCLAAACEALAGDATLGGIALRVLQAGDPDRIDADGIGLTSRLGQINVDHGLSASAGPSNHGRVLGPLGGAALWRRSALQGTGGFRPGYFLYWEDFDLALRMNAGGFGFRCVPEARVLHVGSGTIGRWSPRNVFYMVRNHWACLLANLPASLLRRLAPALLLAPVRSAGLYALRGRPLAALAGLVCGLAMLPRAYRWRSCQDPDRAGASGGVWLEPLLSAADENRHVMKARR
jgi:GT2 family glycosyltransferase